MKALIVVTPKKTVLDPQGKAVANAIHQLGLPEVKDARVGRYIELTLEGSATEACKQKLEGICRDLLSNPVIEDYTLKIEK
ncbi:MAG: phosphoribosylformylglycinamidine synthase subunit PurS [Verrucomicrobiae bacterium]|nr:phosphoribosylformylglycinamidine synthase subunit PurS [Verrucomicrobiae bacterium]